MTSPPAKPDPSQDPAPYWADDDGTEPRRWVLSKDSPFRLDQFLKNQIGRISRNQLQKIIDLDGVTLNGKKPKPSKRLKAGDVIEVLLPPRPAHYLKPQAIPLHALFEDDHMIVLNKQADLTVHPAKAQTDGTMINGLAFHFMQQRFPGITEPQAQAVAAREADQPDTDDEPAHDFTIEGLSTVGADDPNAPRPGIVHRLDKHTTGVIVVAKRDDSHWLIARQFEHRTNLKAYLAVVHGCPDPPSGVIDEPLTTHHTIREAQAVRHDSQAKQSVTLYRVRERYQGFSLVELELKTGRTHQIRVHLQYLGHPIAGDILYGGEPIGLSDLDAPPTPAGGRPGYSYGRDKTEGRKLAARAAERDDLLLAVPALHAALLRIKHPVTDEPMTFTAPVHQPMHTLITALRERPAPGPVITDGTHIDLTQAVPDAPPA